MSSVLCKVQFSADERPYRRAKHGQSPRWEQSPTNKVKRVDICVLFERAAREIDVATAVAHVLSRRHGLTTEIVQQYQARATIFGRIRPNVVVLPYAYHERYNNHFLLRWRKAAFFNLTWEQLFYPGVAVAKMPRGEFAVRHVIHHAWSDAYADLLRAIDVPEQHIFVNGQPAYALYQEPYRRYFKPRSQIAQERGLDPARRWVFLPENYNWAFYDDAMLAELIRSGQPAAQVAAMRDVVTASFEAAMRWCAALARRSDVELIIRPRPATSPDQFRMRVEEVVGTLPPRLSITVSDTVREWILASDVVISSYSTSLIEAAVAGRPSFILEPVPWPEFLHNGWHALLPHLRSEDEMIAAVMAPSEDGDSPLATWARSTLMSRGDPIVRIADELARIRAGSVPIPEPPPWWSVTPEARFGMPKRLLYELRRHFPPSLWPAFRRVDPMLVGDAAAAREVPERVRRWGPILDEYLESVPLSPVAEASGPAD
jgi:surface carbohydrate biosynthesis protein